MLIHKQITVSIVMGILCCYNETEVGWPYNRVHKNTKKVPRGSGNKINCQMLPQTRGSRDSEKHRCHNSRSSPWLRGSTTATISGSPSSIRTSSFTLAHWNHSCSTERRPPTRRSMPWTFSGPEEKSTARPRRGSTMAPFVGCTLELFHSSESANNRR